MLQLFAPQYLIHERQIALRTSPVSVVS